jgi:ethanolamine ammonia-lyase small subunit
MTKDPVTPSPWGEWRSVTPARLALGRVGTGMPTEEVLRFGWAHAMAGAFLTRTSPRNCAR